MDALILWSIRHRLLVIFAALGLTAYGASVALRMPVDVFPDLTAPTVTVVTEAHGLAPQEVETVVTFPIEAAVNGATAVRRVRSASGLGISVVWVEFEWGTDIFVARQIVNEKLQLVSGQLPPDLGPPALTPISSIMGEIQFLAVTSDRHTALEMREIADFSVRRRLMSVPGVAQVVPIGGEVKQYVVELDPARLAGLAMTADEVARALEHGSGNATGGLLVRGPQETLIRAIGRAGSVDDLARTVVTVRDGVPVTVGDLGRVGLGAAPKRGEGSAHGKPAVVLAIQKQPGANTLTVTEAIARQLDDLRTQLPEGMVIDSNLLRQADFIETAVGNVATALRDGALLVALIIMLFLVDVRATVISLASLPVSLIVAVLALDAADITLNTMTLGGLTIAIGALVDDAIIDVENIVRRLRGRPGEPPLVVVYEASREIRGSIVFATLIVMLVFVPVFFLVGVEGRLLAPLGFAYIIAVFASLLVALTVTPAMSAALLPKGSARHHGDGWLVLRLKTLYVPTLALALRRPGFVLGGAALALACAVMLALRLGTTFLPEFNEGALTLSVVTLPGTSLAESDRIGRRVEEILLSHPEVAATDRRTGRAELDEHAQDVNASEIDVRLHPSSGSREAMLASMRAAFAALPGTVVTIGQPIAHRIDHLLSGTRASIAVKVFGDDLPQLRLLAEQIRAAMAEVPGAVDVSVEQQVDVPQLAVAFDRERLAPYGLQAGAAAEAVEAALMGRKVGQMLEGDRTFDVVLRARALETPDREGLGELLIDTPTGARVPLKMLADLRPDAGPNTISRENVQRKIVVMANVAGRDLGAVVADIRAAVGTRVDVPPGFHVAYGGQFESAEEASRVLSILGAVVIAAIFLLLSVALGGGRNAALVMVNLPLALIGGVVAAWLGGGVLSVGSLVGFITLFGVATRNGIMLVSHYDHLMRHEGASLDEAVTRGSLERLSPVLMTALCAGLALVPLVLAGHAPGNEIQAPMGVVILGGLATSTALNMIVLPVLFARFGRRGAGTNPDDGGDGLPAAISP